jgi:hypothetical protein
MGPQPIPGGHLPAGYAGIFLSLWLMKLPAFVPRTWTLIIKNRKRIK